MIAYILNFVLCSGLLLLVYRLFLRNENLYRFNRFYLLFSLVFSLVVPFMTIHVPKVPLLGEKFNNPVSNTIIITPTSQPVIDKTTSVLLNTTVYQREEPIIAPVKVNEPIQQYTLGFRLLDYLPQALITLYIIAVMALLIRFIRNSYRISRSVAQNVVVNYHDTKLVLIDEDVTPHTFLKYVFISKKDYRDGAIEPEIICHEQTHVRQLHSLDIILVELFQIICLFNPFIPFYRRAIQLNHEFLADEEVLKNYHDTPAYQYLLLNKASQLCSLSLTSPFNYQTTKKRLIMMTKTTSAKIALYKKFVLIPVMAGALLVFCHKVIAQNLSAQNPTEINTTLDAMIARGVQPILAESDTKIIPPAKYDAPGIVLNEYAKIMRKYKLSYNHDTRQKLINRTLFTKADRLRLQELYNQMSKEQQSWGTLIFDRLILPPHKLEPNAKVFASWQKDEGYNIWIDGKEVGQAELSKHKPSDFAHYDIGRYVKTSPYYGKHKWEVDLMTPAYFANDCKNTVADNFQIPILKLFPQQTRQSALKAAEKDADDVTKDTADNNYRVTQIKYDSDGRDVLASKTDAPQSVIDEYQAILKKCDLPYKQGDAINLEPNISGADREQLKALYIQMSRDQQNAQYVWIRPKDPMPFRLKHQPPTQQQLADWQHTSTENYLISVDHYVIKDHAELAKYKPSDFNSAFTGSSNKAYFNDNGTMKLHKGTVYFVNLETNGYFDKALKEISAKKEWAVSDFSKQREELVMANW